MIINCSKKLIKQFNIGVSDSLSNPQILFENLYAKSFKIGRADFVVFLDLITSFTVFYIDEPDHDMELAKLYAYSLAITLECYGYRTKEINSVLHQLGDVSYTILNNKTILTLLNNKVADFKKRFLAKINRDGTANIEEIANVINTESYLATDSYHSPKSIFLGQITPSINGKTRILQ